MALTQTQVSQLYVSVFGRASEGDGNTYWQTNQADMTSTAAAMLDTDAAKDYFGTKLDDDQAFIEYIYENTLGKTVAEDPDGIAYWVTQLTDGKSKAEVIVDLINAAQSEANAGDAQDQFNNKVEVSDYTASKIAEFTTFAEFTAYIDGVDHTEESVTEGKGEVDAAITAATGSDFYLTANQDKIADFTGNAGDDHYYADVVQVGGPQVNSLATGDVLDGQGGNDTLEAQVTEGLYMGNSNMAIQPRTTNIETVRLEALEADMDTEANSEVYVNAKNMLGVDELSSWHSDANLTIQNLTTLNESHGMRNLSDMTIGMRYSGNDDSHWNESDFKVYFDQDYLSPKTNLGEQVVSYRLMNEDAYDLDSSAPLKGVYIGRLEFTLNGKTYDLADNITEDVKGLGTEIQTYAELKDAVSAALTKLASDNPDVPELATITADLGGSFTSDNGRQGTEITFSIPGNNSEGVANTLEVSPFFAELRPAEGDGAVENSNRYERSAIEDVTATQELRINVALEKAGLAADGGELVIGSMAKDNHNEWGADTDGKGINTFDVTVYGNSEKPSSLASLRSTNNNLKEVNVKSDPSLSADFADLTIGNSRTNQDADHRGDDEALKDVQTFNAAEFKGDLTLSATLTDEIMAKYLNLKDDDNDHTADNVNFVYTGGEGNDKLTFDIDGMPVAHEDFTFAVKSGDGNDVVTTDIDFNNDERINASDDDNWEYGDHKALDNLSIDTGAGNDVVKTIGDGDFIISTGSGDDAVYTNNSGLKVSGDLVNEVQSIKFGQAGDVLETELTRDDLTIELSNGATFTVDTIASRDSAEVVAQKVVAEINAAGHGKYVTAVQKGDTVELTYSKDYIEAAESTNGDVGDVKVKWLSTDVTVTLEGTGNGTGTISNAVKGVAETAVVEFTDVVGDKDTITFDNGAENVDIEVTDTDKNGTIDAFEIVQQVNEKAGDLTNWKVGEINPSLGRMSFTATSADDVDDLLAPAGEAAVVSYTNDGTTVLVEDSDGVKTATGVKAVEETGKTGATETITITNGADQNGTLMLGVDLDGNGTINADTEMLAVSISKGNEADVAEQIASYLNGLTELSAKTDKVNNESVVKVTYDIIGDSTTIADMQVMDSVVKSADVTEVTKGRLETSETQGATWVVNAENREIDDLNGTDAIAESILYGSVVTITLSEGTYASQMKGITNDAAVAYKNGFEAKAVIPTDSSKLFAGDQYEVNQAIKAAIQNDTIMQKLLSVTDGPEGTLIIESLVDGKVLDTDLAIKISAPTSLNANELASLNLAYKDMINDSSKADLTEAEMIAVIAENASKLDAIYSDSTLATDEGKELAGHNSTDESDNVVDLGSGHDLVVLGTDARSNDTIKFTGSDIGTNVIFNFVADSSANGTDYLDFSEYLTNTTSASGSASSATLIDGDYVVGGTAITENDVVFINSFEEDKANKETWDNLDGDKLKTAIINKDNTDYGNLTSSSLDVSDADSKLVGKDIKNIILVENDHNEGEYKVFEATSSATDNEFTTIKLLGKIDFGETITQMHEDDGTDNDGANDDGSTSVTIPSTVSYGGAGFDHEIGTSGNDTFVVVGSVASSDYGVGATYGTKAAYFEDAVNAIENGQAFSDISGDIYQGGAGTDTLEIWGDVDFTSATLNSIEAFDIHSNVTFKAEQLVGTKITTASDSVVMIDLDGDGVVDKVFGGETGDSLSGLQQYIDDEFSSTPDEPNQAPTIAADQNFTVLENSDEGVEVGKVVADDADDDDDLTYTLADNDNFVINADTGVITVKAGADLDFEAAVNTFDLAVTVSDGEDDATATVNVTLENDPSDDDSSTVDVPVSVANDEQTYSATAATETFTIDNSASFTYSIENFEIGTDVIDMPDGATVLQNAAGPDGTVGLQWTSPAGVLIEVNLLGLTDAEDAALSTSAGWGDSWV